MKKGFTVVELVVTFSVTVVIATFLLQLILSLNNIYLSSGVKTEIMNKQSLISNQINKTLTEKSVRSLTSCGNYCLKFNYTDYTSDVFTIDYATNVLSFGDYSTNLPEDTYFKNVSVDIVYAATVDETDNNAILNIKIPIKNDNIKDDFYVNVAYQYNTDEANIEYVNFEGNGSYIVLKGETEQTFNTQTAFVEEGYTVYNANGSVITGNVEIDNPLTSLPYKAGNYKIKYSLKDDSGNIISQATRSVTVKPSTYDITNLIENGSFEDGMNGWKITGGWESAETTAKATAGSEYSLSGNNSLKIDVNTSVETYMLIDSISPFSTPIGHKYYLSTYAYVPQFENGTNGYYIFSECYSSDWTGFTFNYFERTRVPVNSWTRYSQVIANSSIYVDTYYRFGPYLMGINESASVIGYIDDIIVIDLTETFGAGNEPSKEWCDENIEWFEGTTKINY